MTHFTESKGEYVGSQWHSVFMVLDGNNQQTNLCEGKFKKKQKNTHSPEKVSAPGQERTVKRKDHLRQRAQKKPALFVDLLLMCLQGKPHMFTLKSSRVIYSIKAVCVTSARHLKNPPPPPPPPPVLLRRES